MNFNLTAEQKDIYDLVSSFAASKIAPLAEAIDKEGRYPKETIDQLAEMGIMSLNVPEEYGGSNLDEVCKVIAIMEIARHCASTAEIVAVHLVTTDLIKIYGTEEQKKKYFSIVAKGGVGAFALTEPGAGSDAGAAKTKAIADGDDYVIDGTKCFISNMGREEGAFVILIALTKPELGVKGMSAILVDKDTPGFSIGKTEDKMGIRGGAVSELVFEGCRVPKTNLLGEEGKGFNMAMIGLDGGRIGMAAQAVGISEAALAASIKYSKERVQFGKPISAQQGLQWYMADMATRTEAAKLLTFQAAAMRQEGKNITKLASMAKYFASENAVEVTNKALQIHGGYGYMRDYPIERMYRDARIIPLYEGTSEIQKMVIARDLLK